MGSTGRLNQAQGRSFEDIIAFHAGRHGVLALQNGQKVRWMRGGRMVAVRSMLDWSFIWRGAAAFVDTKSFGKAYFTRGQLDERQVILARRIAAQGCLAGFLVQLRASDLCVFYTVQQIGDVKPRGRFTPTEGLTLGTTAGIDVRKIFTVDPGEPKSIFGL